MSDNFFDFESDELLGGPAAPAPRDSRHKPGTKSKPSTKAAPRNTSNLRATNKFACGYVALLAVVSAIPIGMNRPVFWLLFTGVISLSLLAYLMRSYQLDSQRTLRSYGQWKLISIALIVPIFALVQSIPVGPMFDVPFFEGPFNQVNQLQLTMSTISLAPSASTTAALRYAGYIIFAILAFEAVGHQPRAKRFGVWIFWGVVAHALWGLVALRMLGDIHFWGEKEYYLGSVTGVFINRNSFATFLAMGACIGLALQLDKSSLPQQRKNRVRPLISPETVERMPQWIGLAIIFVALLGTQSRMGLVAGLLGAFVILIAGLRKHDISWRSIFIVSFAGSFIALSAGFILVGDGALERAVFLESNIRGRLESYLLALDLIAERPLLGYGFDSFRIAFEQVQDAPMRMSLIWDRAHSTYLAHWVELGLIVGTAPIILGGYVFYGLIKRLVRQETDYGMPLAALGALVAGSVHSLVDFSLEMPANVIMLIAIVVFGLSGRGPASSSSATPSEPETQK